MKMKGNTYWKCLATILSVNVPSRLRFATGVVTYRTGIEPGPNIATLQAGSKMPPSIPDRYLSSSHTQSLKGRVFYIFSSTLVQPN